jgi:hypothetical protein
MTEAPGSSETSVLTRATRRNNPEVTILGRNGLAQDKDNWRAVVDEVMKLRVL